MIINNQTPYQFLSPALAKRSKANSETSATTDADNSPSASSASSADQLAVSENNLTAAIPDMDAAKSSLEFARKSIMGQPSLAMLAQANSISPDALRLLQQ
jgi:flagellin-like hook-associated protein FlgL